MGLKIFCQKNPSTKPDPSNVPQKENSMEQVLKLICSMVKTIQGKTLALKAAEASNKQNKNYSAGLKTTSKNLHNSCHEHACHSMVKEHLEALPGYWSRLANRSMSVQTFDRRAGMRSLVCFL